MKNIIQWICLIIMFICILGLFASIMYAIMHYDNPTGGFYQLSEVKFVIDNFFNWIFAICLTFLVIDKE